MPHMEMDTIKFDFNEILQVYVILLTVVQTGSINHFSSQNKYENRYYGIPLFKEI